MGLTYAQSFLRSHITNKEDMMILEKSPEKAKFLAEKDIGTVYGDPKDCIKNADLVIFAVKPQDSKAVFESIKDHIDRLRKFHRLKSNRTEAGPLVCTNTGRREVVLAYL